MFLIYLYNLYYYKKKNNTNNNNFIKKLSKIFFIPFEKSDRFIKNKINTKYINFFININKLKKKMIIKTL